MVIVLDGALLAASIATTWKFELQWDHQAAAVNGIKVLAFFSIV
jgi:hypothetical protein